MMKWMNFRMKILLFIIACVVMGGTVGFAILEGFSYFDALYLTIITIATVGYGDIHPVTQAGKTLAIFLILGGTGSFLGLFATITETFVSKEERTESMDRLNMTVGVFFSEFGNKLMTSIPCENIGKITEKLSAITQWEKRDFAAAKKEIGNIEIEINTKKMDMKKLVMFLSDKRDFLLRLLENPNLIEHETFADLLQAVLHLSEEIEIRKGGAIYDKYGHIEEDLETVYLLMIKEWIEYMRFLKFNYPHFFSFMAMNSPLCKVE